MHGSLLDLDPGKGLLGLRSRDNVESGPEKTAGSQFRRYVLPYDLKKYWLPKGSVIGKTFSSNAGQS